MFSRAQSPTRMEAFAKAMAPKNEYNEGVLIGDWVERRIKCEQDPPAFLKPTDINCTYTHRLKVKPTENQSELDSQLRRMFEESDKRQAENEAKQKEEQEMLLRQQKIDEEKAKATLPQLGAGAAMSNKLKNFRGSGGFQTDPGCDKNFTTTYDLVYNHLPKPLYGPNYRVYKRSTHNYEPQPDLAVCCGNLTKWGLQEYLEYEWERSGISDYISTLYQDTYVNHGPDGFEKKRRFINTSFTKSFKSLHSK